MQVRKPAGGGGRSREGGPSRGDWGGIARKGVRGGKRETRDDVEDLVGASVCVEKLEEERESAPP